MDVIHGALLFLTLATLAATIYLLKQRIQPLFEDSTTRAVEQQGLSADIPMPSQPLPIPEPKRPPRVAVNDDERAWINERKEREQRKGEIVP